MKLKHFMFTIIILMTICFIPNSSFIASGQSTHHQSISINAGHTLALTEDGNGNKHLLSWGWNQFGQLGNDQYQNKVSPVEVYELDNKSIVSIAAGEKHSLALTNTGTVYSWGANNSGQLGCSESVQMLCEEIEEGEEREFSNYYSSPQQVKAYVLNAYKGTYELTRLRNIIAIDTGDNHSIALKADGTVWTWGSNDYGQLGQHDYTQGHNLYAAEKVSGLANIIDVSTFRSHNLALDSEGDVWVWGENWGGQMPTNLSSTIIPYKVEGLPKIQSISTGSYHSLALDMDGNVWTWGINDFNQRKDKTENYATPIMVNGLPTIKKITTGDAHNLVLDLDGNVWAWGNNSYGEIAIAPTTETLSKPKVIEELNDIKEIDAGEGYSIAKSSMGDIYTWGRNLHGQLGDGTSNDRHTPKKISIKFVTGIELDRHSVDLKPNETFQLNATVIPEDSIETDIIWTSSNEQVVSVDQDGRITAVSDSATEHRAIITATTKSGRYSDSCEVTIKVPTTGIDITKNTLTLERVLTDHGLKDESYQLTALVYPFNATDKRIIWKSEDPEVVSVDTTGRVTAMSEGKTKVTATTIDGGWKDEITLYVTISVSEIHIVGNKQTLDLNEGEKFKLDYYIYPMNATNQYIYNWSSSDKDVATVSSDGVVTAHEQGNTTITVTTLDKRRSGTIRVKVEDSPYLKLSGFHIPQSLSMKAREVKMLNPEFFPKYATNKRIYWSSNDDDIVKVAENGKLTALASGKATITARTADGGYKREVIVNVGTNGQGLLLKKPRHNVSVYKTWYVNFNLQLNKNSITDSHVHIKDKYNQKIESNLYLSNDRKTIIIDPKTKLEANSNYYLYITDGVESYKGINLSEGILMEFETR